MKFDGKADSDRVGVVMVLENEPVRLPRWRRSQKPVINPQELEGQDESERIREIASYLSLTGQGSQQIRPRGEARKESAQVGRHLRAVRREAAVRRP